MRSRRVVSVLARTFQRNCITATLLVLFLGACNDTSRPLADLAAKPSDSISPTGTPSSVPPGKPGNLFSSESKPSGPPPKPTPLPLPFTPDPNVPIKLTINPRCVLRGGFVTLAVRTEPNAVVAYQAIYSDSQTGSKPPTGKGYGGNDSGNADASGHYTSVWSVMATAPPGPARVDVFVGASGHNLGYKSVEFAVADSAGKCS